MKKYLAFYGTSPLQMNRKENSICHFAKLSLSLNDILKSRLTNRFGFLRSKFVFNIPTTYLHPGISDYLVKSLQWNPFSADFCPKNLSH